jgi:hypothetical protein
MLLALVFPALWVDFTAGQTTMLAVAGMVAVIRWPSVRTVALYAVLVALVPKPAYLPVLVYGLWHVRASWPYVLAIGAAGLVMLAWPGYLGNLLVQGSGAGDPMGLSIRLPLVLSVPLAALATWAGLRRPGWLGVAAVLLMPYWWGYAFLPLILVVVPARRA